MNSNTLTLHDLDTQIEGTVHSDDLHKIIYATDASIYRELPTGVVFPKSEEDIQKIILWAQQSKIPLIPRAAGTSLSGQCVGTGLVVDVSKHLNQILDFDTNKQIVTLQPGVVRDELNLYLEPHHLFFSPITSTSNRCTIGGMVGNNSSGTTSISYGVTRDKVTALEGYLSDGSKVVFKDLSPEQVIEKTKLDTLEGAIYRQIIERLSDTETQKEIEAQFPKPQIHRRNTGYAVDILLQNYFFDTQYNAPFNLAKLLTGSEGTLIFVTKISIKTDPLPPAKKAMLVPHFSSINDCCRAVIKMMQHPLYTCEMMDKTILDCTKNNIQQRNNRHYIKGDPTAVLMLELAADTTEELEILVNKLTKTIEGLESSYHTATLYGADVYKVHQLRAAGLGLLGNIVGDKKAVACIEDTAVAIEDLADYIINFGKLMEHFGQESVYYAHAGAGELHLRPILNLKKESDQKLLREISNAVADLVKKYKGSLSGEHGDGRVRAEFIEKMIGAKNYQLLIAIKNFFDPNQIFNPGKIVNAPPMDTALRFSTNQPNHNLNTLMDFSDSEGYLRVAEKCNGSGDCRKSQQMSGTMCPSYHATKDEKHTTRARANALREILTQSDKVNKFDSPLLKEALDLCISCKACASECPSNVDMASLRSEFLYQYHKNNRRALRDYIFAYNTVLNKISAHMPNLSKKILSQRFVKKSIGIHPKRNLPIVQSFNFKSFLGKTLSIKENKPKLLLLIDEFSRYLEIDTTKDCIELLCRLGYAVDILYYDSARAELSKGFLKQAKSKIDSTLTNVLSKASQYDVLIGIEPSAILGFRDEYLRIADASEQLKETNLKIQMIEEFIAQQIADGHILPSMFHQENKAIKIHIHCHQKSLSNTKVTFDLLNLPTNYQVTIMNTGCCGMAGTFGYQKEHYQVSQDIAALKLLPIIRKTAEETIIVANGTSCKHQISDLSDREAQHPISVLNKAFLGC